MPDAHGWEPIAAAPNNEVLLVQHEDDLFPVVAYQYPDGTQWLYQTDGPEDVETGDHRHEPLRRAPTHYRRLGFGPVKRNG